MTRTTATMSANDGSCLTSCSISKLRICGEINIYSTMRSAFSANKPVATEHNKPPAVVGSSFRQIEKQGIPEPPKPKSADDGVEEIASQSTSRVRRRIRGFRCGRGRRRGGQRLTGDGNTSKSANDFERTSLITGALFPTQHDARPLADSTPSTQCSGWYEKPV